jgi:hypothetical protein
VRDTLKSWDRWFHQPNRLRWKQKKTHLAVQAEHNVGVAALGVTADKVYPSQHAHGQEAWQRRHRRLYS